MSEEDVFHVHTQCHLSLSDEEDDFRQFVLQFFGDVDCLAVIQVIAVHEERDVISFGGILATCSDGELWFFQSLFRCFRNRLILLFDCGRGGISLSFFFIGIPCEISSRIATGSIAPLFFPAICFRFYDGQDFLHKLFQTTASKQRARGGKDG